MTDYEHIGMVTGDKFFKGLDYCIEAQLVGGGGASTIVLMEGPPGTGKTQKVNGPVFSYKTWKEVNGSRHLGIDNPSVYVHVICLSQNDSVDIGGAWAPDFERDELKHLIVKDILGVIKNVDADIIIIFFDDLGNANAGTLAAVQGLLEDGAIRGQMKESNCVYMAATNRPEDGCNAIKLPRSLRDGRRITVPMGVDKKEWLPWAKEAGIHVKVRSAIEWRGALLYSFDPKSKGTNPTPRGWQKLSNILYQMDHDGHDVDILEMLAPGCVGEGAWAVTKGFWDHEENLASHEEILADPEGAKLPGGGRDSGDGPSGQWAMASNISYELSLMKSKNQHLPVSDAEALITYINRFDDEIAMFAIRTCGDSHGEFKECSAYSAFIEKTKDYTIRES